MSEQEELIRFMSAMSKTAWQSDLLNFVNAEGDVVFYEEWVQAAWVGWLLKSEESAEEQFIGVWNPSTKEIALSTSGVRLVDFAHWHCHCTIGVFLREMVDHPLVKARNQEKEV